ncbi:hypothetical protein [Citrobacter koseri]|uniref:hypothetical protein n=1 Tax=Citrobacter koseri TaxID=545 RepID=UPI00389138E0
MGGLITTAARLKDGMVVSFRHYTCNNFNLILNEDDFLNEVKRSCPSVKISPKRRYMKLDRDGVIERYKKTFSKTGLDYIYGNSFLAPVGYGMNFYDYKNNVAFSVNGFSSNLHFLTYNLMFNPIIMRMLKDGVMFTEEDLARLSFNIPQHYINEILIFKELKNTNSLYYENGSVLELNNMSVFEAILSLFDNKLVKPECFRMQVKYPEWDFYSFPDEKEGFNKLKGYLEKENILTKNDKIAWNIFEEDAY